MVPDFACESQVGGRVAGVDEVGRGPLAGPVTAAAVVLDVGCIPVGLDDSKALSAKKRAGTIAKQRTMIEERVLLFSSDNLKFSDS